MGDFYDRPKTEVERTGRKQRQESWTNANVARREDVSFQGMAPVSDGNKKTW
jgi:hypothetical protein